MRKIVVLFCLAITVATSAQAMQKHHMLNTANNASYFVGQSNLVFEDTLNTMQSLGWNIQYCNLEKGKIYATVATNPWTWMDVLYVEIQQEEFNQVKVTARSDSGDISGLTPHMAFVDNLYEELGHKHQRL